MKKIILLAFCLISTSLLAAQGLKPPSEYLLSSESIKTEKEISSIFGKTSLKKITAAGKDRFVLVFMPDPGLKKLKGLLEKSKKAGSIQPNLKYQLIQPVKETPKSENRLQKK